MYVLSSTDYNNNNNDNNNDNNTYISAHGFLAGGPQIPHILL